MRLDHPVYAASRPSGFVKACSRLAQRHALGAHVILRQRGRLLPRRGWPPVLDIIEKASGHLGEMLFVPDAQRARNRHPPLPAKLDETDARIRRLQPRNPTLDGSGNIGNRHDVEFRPVSLRGTLAKLQSRTAASIARSVRIVAHSRLPVPPGLDGNVNTADLVLEAGIAELFERVFLDPRLQIVGPTRVASHLAKLRRAERRWPPARVV
jgi:hypothetical protein